LSVPIFLTEHTGSWQRLCFMSLTERTCPWQHLCFHVFDWTFVSLTKLLFPCLWLNIRILDKSSVPMSLTQRTGPWQRLCFSLRLNVQVLDNASVSMQLTERVSLTTPLFPCLWLNERVLYNASVPMSLTECTGIGYTSVPMSLTERTCRWRRLCSYVLDWTYGFLTTPMCSRPPTFKNVIFKLLP
jgi:hypothetical protein